MSQVLKYAETKRRLDHPEYLEACWQRRRNCAWELCDGCFSNSTRATFQLTFTVSSHTTQILVIIFPVLTGSSVISKVCGTCYGWFISNHFLIGSRKHTRGPNSDNIVCSYTRHAHLFQLDSILELLSVDSLRVSTVDYLFERPRIRHHSWEPPAVASCSARGNVNIQGPWCRHRHSSIAATVHCLTLIW